MEKEKMTFIMEKKITYILDTNVLLDYPQILENSTDKLVILMSVLEELDALKKHINPDVAIKARKAGNYIVKNYDKIQWDTEERFDSVDDQLLEATREYNGVLVTNDTYLRIKCEILGVKAINYTWSNNYTGIYDWFINLDENNYNTDLDNALTNGDITGIKDKLYNNEYVVARNAANGEVLCSFVHCDDKLKFLNPKNIKIENNWIGTITPRNNEQLLLFYSLLNRNNTILYAGGNFGTGKSFILNNFALQELEKGKISKIVYVPNNAYTNNTIDIGAMPGELLEKTINQIGPLVDLVGIDKIKDMIAREDLEVVPMGFIRGRSFNNSIIIVNEAQNLTEDHVKLLIGRCGENTRIMFDGDIKQTDNTVFKNKNGLKLLLNLRYSPQFSKIFSTVKLLKTERSETAEAAAFLDECFFSL